MLADEMELRHLRYFIAVAEAENVSRAALKLYVSQPALSRQIRDLEEEIGFKLLERSAKSVRLTAAGKTFQGEARAVLQRVEEALKVARNNLQFLPPDDVVEQIDAAIAKAEGCR